MKRKYIIAKLTAFALRLHLNGDMLRAIWVRHVIVALKAEEALQKPFKRTTRRILENLSLKSFTPADMSQWCNETIEPDHQLHIAVSMMGNTNLFKQQDELVTF